MNAPVFALTYPTLRDEHDGRRIHEIYRVAQWPTIVILDRRGIVRHVQCGYRPDARGTLGAKIRELLAEQDVTASSSIE